MSEKIRPGYHWRYWHGKRVVVCDTCNGNCGQCSDTGYFDRTNGAGNTPPASMQSIVDSTRSRGLLFDWLMTFAKYALFIGAFVLACKLGILVAGRIL